MKRLMFFSLVFSLFVAAIPLTLLTLYSAKNEFFSYYEVLFITRDDTDLQTISEETEWRVLIEKSLLLIPSTMHKIMTENGEKKITIYIDHDPNSIFAGKAGGGVGGKILLNRAYLNNQTATEKVIHELGHIYHDSDSAFDVPSFRDLVFRIEFPPTTAAFKTIEKDGNREIFYDAREDYAESFVLFVMWPEVLRDCCPIRYEFMKNVFGKEY